METTTSKRLSIRGDFVERQDEILTEEALLFIESLELRFGERRREILDERLKSQIKIDQSIFPDFLDSTLHIRESNWKVAPIPDDLLDRRVEITGPVDRKMIINALNSGVKVFMADFEDSNSPTWSNCIMGQINLKDAVDRTITFNHPSKDKTYKLNKETATLMVRPRGWHLEEKNVYFKGKPISASIFDFGLYFFHNVRKLKENSTGPYFYLPKLESHLEAKLWNDIFVFAQSELDIPNGTIKATVLIETIMAAFQMDEILYELRDHSAGLNCGRWDYIFSFIKKFRVHSDFVLPDRSEVGMDRHFLNSYVRLLVYTCHKRGIHAMGGMAAQIPIKNDIKANEVAMNKVREDKKREAKAGHDGTWIAHPGLAGIALEAFNKVMKNDNQINSSNENPNITQKDLLKVPSGIITENGLRENIRVGIYYIEAWLRGNGCVPLYNLMEDAATAEISRAQLWQWIRNGAKLDDGRKINEVLFLEFMEDEMKKMKLNVGNEVFDGGKFRLAETLFTKMIKKSDFDEFLTLPAYQYI